MHSSNDSEIGRVPMSRYPQGWFCFLGLCVAVMLVVTAIALPGPPQFHPLKLKVERPAGASPKAALPQEEQNAFYYANGKKVFLKDTGLAVVKLKKDTKPEDPTLPFRKATLAAGSPLSDLAGTLQRSGMVVVNTRGIDSLSLDDGQKAHPQHIEYMMPVVEAISGPTGEGVNGADQMIMTARVTARFERGVTEDDINSSVKSAGLKVTVKQEVPNGFILELAEGIPSYSRVLQAANELYEKGKAVGKVVYAHPDFVPTKKKLQNPSADPLLRKQWHLDNSGGEGGKAMADVRALEAWKIHMGRSDILIAIVDDCVEKSHPDLKPNFKKGRYYNGLTGEITDDPSPRDTEQQHGTSCAGVAVADANEVGGRGLAPNCGLIGVNFWDASVAQTADAFYFCNNNGASVISCSWSWGPAFDAVSVAIKDLYAVGRGGKGSIIVFAAGNEASAISSKQQFGTLEEVICVGATNWRDDHSPYSNFGPELSVVAPSNDRWWIRPESLGILTTDNTENSPHPQGGFSGYTNGDFTAYKGEQAFGGTSSATPLVAGLCGLILSVNDNLTAKEVREIVETTADKILGELRPAHYDASGHDPYYGFGRINAYRALVEATGGTPGPIEVLSVIVTSSAQHQLGQPGEKDLYQFNALQNAKYTIETDGPTDVFASLFGPNSQTTLIAQNDDGGVDSNSRIIADLGAGTYFVEVRHYNKMGTGGYGIRVSR